MHFSDILLLHNMRFLHFQMQVIVERENDKFFDGIYDCSFFALNVCN